MPNFEANNLYLYDGIGGSGFHRSKIVASRKAISEVIERRAYLEASSDKEKGDPYGFLNFHGTTGMAAYPAYSCHKAREIALLEAQERWSLLHWWGGFLPADTGSFNGLPYISIKSQFNSFSVISWHDRAGKRAYGFAAGKTLKKALEKSMIELSVNRSILDHWGDKDLPSTAIWIEKRLIFFSREEGQSSFMTLKKPEKDSKIA